MCAICETRKLCERLDRQIKNLEAGGSINPDALATVIREARDALNGFSNTATIIDAMLRGDIQAAAIIVTGVEADDGVAGKGGLH